VGTAGHVLKSERGRGERAPPYFPPRHSEGSPPGVRSARIAGVRAAEAAWDA